MNEVDSSDSRDSVKQDTRARPRRTPTPLPGQNLGGAAVHPRGPNGVLWRALGPDSLMGVRDLREGAERGTRSGGAAAPHGRLLHGVTGFVTLRRKQVPCHNGEPGPRPDTPGSTERLWQAAPGQVTLD